MEKIIYLYWDDCRLGTLTHVDDKYIFTKDEKGYKEAESDGCPIDLLDINSNTVEYDRLPYIFEDFKISRGRTDLINLLHIVKEDSEFDRLYKMALAYKRFYRNGFWIMAEEGEDK